MVVHKLDIVPVNEQCKREVLALLQEAIDRIKDGECPAVTDVLIILNHQGDGEYTELASPVISHTGWIGKMHNIVFQRQMQHYLADEGLELEPPRGKNGPR